MTLPTTLRDIAAEVRACATVAPRCAEALRQIVRQLDVARRTAEALEYDNAVLLAHVPPHWIIDDGITIPRRPVLEDV